MSCIHLSPFVWVNGILSPENQAYISALDRGFTLGDGVFETMRAFGESVLFLDRHLSRLSHSAKTLNINLPSEVFLRAAIREALLVNAQPQAIVRITVSRGHDVGRGINMATTLQESIVVRVVPFIPHPPETFRAGISAVISSIRRNETSPLSCIKSCNYADSILARRQAQARGADDSLMLNTQDHLACATTSNVFTVVDGVLCTPSIDSGVLPGITRQIILEEAQGNGIVTREQQIDQAMLQSAVEIFITNTVQGIVPVLRLEDRPIGTGKPGLVTAQIAAGYKHLVHRNMAKEG